MVAGHGAKFGRKEEAANAALLTHRSIEDAAKAVGIGTQTRSVGLKSRNTTQLTARLDGQVSCRPPRDFSTPFRLCSKAWWTRTRPASTFR
jgi:hypothetical protein